MKAISLLLSLALTCSSAMANEIEKENQPVSAENWLEQLSNSLNTRNFSTSFVVVKDNHAEPYHWFQGIGENDQKLAILSLLNGPTRDILKKGNVVSYIEPDLPPYSLNSDKVSSPIPSVFSGDFSSISNSYDFVIGGKSRILGRSAQLVRISARDEHRNDHWLWLDQSTGLLLKMVTTTKQGQLLEQIQFTHLNITSEPTESLKQLAQKELPKVLDIPEGYQEQKMAWRVNWMPQNFEKLNANRHRMKASKKPVEFMLFSDGLVDVSVYVNPSEEKQRAADFVMDGATVALNQVKNGVEVSVVGKIPSNTAKKIADSISYHNQLVR